MKAWGLVPRGGSDDVQTVAAAEAVPDMIDAVNSPAAAAAKATSALASLGVMLTSSASGLAGSLDGINPDSLLLLLTTPLVPDLYEAVKEFPILGFLATGILA